MHKFDMQSAKFLGLLIAIFFIFIIIVWHAYSYLPQKDTNFQKQDELISSSNTMPDSYEQNSLPENESREEFENQKIVAEDEYKEPIYNKNIDNSDISARNTNDKNHSSADELEPLTSINEESANSQRDSEIKDSETDPLLAALNNAKEFRLNHKPISAISEYQKALSLTNDSAIKAQCYENIALIYASARRYGSALSSAQKAYNSYPTVSRELLLARLYYKTGDSVKANERLQSLLRKDFTIE